MPFATDLHFTLWQKEAGIEVLGWDYKLKRRFVDGGGVIAEVALGNTGLQPDDAYRQGRGFPTNNLNHAAVVSITGLDIPFSTKLWLKTSLRLSEFNTLRKRELTWTFDENQNPAPPNNEGLPLDEGFIFSNYEPDPGNPGKFRFTYTITNDDPTKWFRVNDLFFLLDGSQIPIDEPEQMQAWAGWIPHAGGSFEVAPLTEVDIVLDNLDQKPWLFTKLVKQEITGPGGPATGADPVPTIQVHETPEPGTLSLLAFGGLMLARRRRAR